MAGRNAHEHGEIWLSTHTEARWKRREQELAHWAVRAKQRKQQKRTQLLEHIDVDAELHTTLTLLRQKQVQTEYSCAGVSPLDEPEDHSLYAYITLIASKQSERFVQLAMKRMRHRLLVSFEPERNRYDLSSFYIGHNRSFCLLIQQCAEKLERENQDTQ